MTSFSTVNYDHGYTAPRSTRQWLLSGALLLGALGAFAFGITAIAIVFMIVFLPALLIRPKSPMRVGPRYLICGRDVVYYANVARVVFADRQGLLTLHSTSGATLTLSRDKFLVASRKPDKQRAKRSAKFRKLAARVIERVQTASPDAEFVGMPGTEKA